MSSLCRGPPIAENRTRKRRFDRERERTVNTLNVWCTRFYVTLTLSFFNPIRKQQRHAEACTGGQDDHYKPEQHSRQR